MESLVENYGADIDNKDIDGVSKGSVFTTLQHIHTHSINQSVIQTSLEVYQSTCCLRGCQLLSSKASGSAHCQLQQHLSIGNIGPEGHCISIIRNM